MGAVFQRLVPEAPVRPQGGGRRRHGDREVRAAIALVATSGCTWQQLPAALFGRRVLRRTGSSARGARPGCGPSCTAWSWTNSVPAVSWTGPLRDRLREHAGLEKGDLTGPSPVDRGKYGSKIHLITDRNGLPLSVGISGANVHDSQALIPLVKGIPAVRSRRGPRGRRPAKLHVTTATTTATCADGDPHVPSGTASPAKAWTAPSGWAATAGPSKAP